MPTPTLTLNLSDGSVRFNFSIAAAEELQACLSALKGQWQAAAVEAGPISRPGQLKPMEYRHTGEVFLEIFCNPNIWTSAFAARVLITLRDDRIRLTTETTLPQLYEDICHYLE
ncbi:MAG: hypothetical protein KGQ93_07965 [Cyanobacteria bacterium REEB459]|nr:hypothetical protein [Cyanobacteria bacterium REEB459]